MWDPGQYQRYSDERARPFFDLLAQVRAKDPVYVVDLGCGPGTMTAVLTERWPAAIVQGVDSSPGMIEEAHGYTVPGRLSFTASDLRQWRPPRPVDVLVSNATLQWVPGHLDLLSRFVEVLAPGGWFAFQVPGNYREPSHTILAEMRHSDRWRSRLAGVPERGIPVAEPGEYLRALTRIGRDREVARSTGMGVGEVDVWETTYYHVLQGENPVLEWVKGTALRPVLDVLDGHEREEFVSEYGARLREAYPPDEFGTVLPFRRIFATVRKEA